MSWPRKIILVVATVLVIAGAIHWLIILGVMAEDLRGVPASLAKPLGWYFHSLAVADWVAAYGLVKQTRWSWWLAVVIALSQLPTHGLVLIYQAAAGFPPDYFRYLDIVLSVALITLFSLRSIKRRFMV